MGVLAGAALFIPFLRQFPVITFLAAFSASSLFSAACFPRDLKVSFTFFLGVHLDQLLFLFVMLFCQQL
jgi:hypothetical protein